MIYYAITMMWIFDNKLDYGSKCGLTKKCICSMPDGRGTVEMEVKWKNGGDNSHNTLPMLNIDMSYDSLEKAQEYLFNGAKVNANFLDKFRIQITDFGQLNVLAVFSSIDIEDIKRIENTRVDMISQIDKFITGSDVFCKLIDSHYIQSGSNCFGIPVELYNSLASTDTRLYDNPVFCTEKKEKEYLLDFFDIVSDDPIYINRDTCLYGINLTPIFFTSRKFDLTTLEYYLEPLNLLLSELVIYSSAISLYGSIMEHVQDEMMKFEKKKIVNLWKNQKNFDIPFLRKIMAKYALLSQFVILRDEYLDVWQVNYIVKYKQISTLIKEKRDLYYRSESLLEKIIEEKQSYEEKKRDTFVDYFLTFISMMGFCTLVCTVVEYLHNSQADELRNFSIHPFTYELGVLLISFFIAFLIFVFCVMKRR